MSQGHQVEALYNQMDDMNIDEEIIEKHKLGGIVKEITNLSEDIEHCVTIIGQAMTRLYNRRHFDKENEKKHTPVTINKEDISIQHQENLKWMKKLFDDQECLTRLCHALYLIQNVEWSPFLKNDRLTKAEFPELEPLTADELTPICLVTRTLLLVENIIRAAINNYYNFKEGDESYLEEMSRDEFTHLQPMYTNLAKDKIYLCAILIACDELKEIQVASYHSQYLDESGELVMFENPSVFMLTKLLGNMHRSAKKANENADYLLGVLNKFTTTFFQTQSENIKLDALGYFLEFSDQISATKYVAPSIIEAISKIRSTLNLPEDPSSSSQQTGKRSKF